MADIGGVDLNLLGPLAALLEERHVSRAAERMTMSQPAMSRALQKLRDALGDELLVRGPSGYQLTPRGERVQRQLSGILPRLEGLLADEPFDPRSGSPTFRLAGTDYVVSIVGPPLLERVFGESPQSTVRFGAWNHAVFDDLARGALDLVLSGAAPPPPLRFEPLFEDRYVCALSAEHPSAGKAALSLDEYLECAHAVVDIADGRQGAVDQRLDALGRPRRASVTVPYHAAAAAAARETQLVATLPRRLADDLVGDPSLVLVDAPPEIPAVTLFMDWHPRLDDDPAQRWLRDLIRTTMAASDRVRETPGRRPRAAA